MKTTPDHGCFDGRTRTLTLRHGTADRDHLLPNPARAGSPGRAGPQLEQTGCAPNRRKRQEAPRARRGLSAQRRTSASPRSVSSDGRLYTERRSGRCGRPKAPISLKCLYSLCVVFASFTSSMAKTCDFTGSGLDSEGKAVRPVYLSCSAGRVSWHHPRAALRLVFVYPAEGRDFRGCVRPAPEIEGARLFVEGHRSLVPLYAKGDGAPHDRERCFSSHRGRAALYLEAEPGNGFREQTAAFEYDLRPAASELYDPLEECRPCSRTELVSLFCSADFAARGLVLSTDDDALLQQTKLTMLATKVFHQTSPIFTADALRNRSLPLPPVDSLPGGAEQPLALGEFFFPLECGARAGPGEFLVLGSVRLHRPMLRCAPSLQEWRQVAESAQDGAHCLLQT